MNVRLIRTEDIFAGDEIEDVNRVPQRVASLNPVGERFDIVLDSGRVLPNEHPLTLWRLR